MNNLPLLNSERKFLLEKVVRLKEEKDLLSGSILRKVTGVINRADFLSEEAKEELLKLIWEK